VRLIAEFHGGRAWAENLPDGTGARFVVRLAR
jgi:signal transduction histidine kinase